MAINGFETREEQTLSYIVYGFSEKTGDKIFLTENGYNPYEWNYEGYRNKVHLRRLQDAEYQADHAPEYVTKVTIEKVTVHKRIATKIDKEIIEYEPKGLEPLICF